MNYLVQFSMRLLDFSIESLQLHYDPGVDQPVTEMSTRYLPGGKGQPTRKADNLTAICELTV
jgi:hypothetical protein